MTATADIFKEIVQLFGGNMLISSLAERQIIKKCDHPNICRIESQLEKQLNNICSFFLSRGK